MNVIQELILSAVTKGYSTDKSGNVLSPLGIKRKLIVRGKIPSERYYQFTIHHRGRKVPVKVHKFMAFLKYGEDSFLPGIQVRHLNGDSLDNSWGNIALGTGSENCMDKSDDTRLRTAKQAAKVLRKLSDEELIQFRADRDAGFSYSKLVEKYGISKSAVSYIVNGKTYK